MKRSFIIACLGVLVGLCTAGCATSRAERIQREEVVSSSQPSVMDNSAAMPQRLDTTYSAADDQIDRQARQLPTDPIDLNSATAEELRRIPGIDEQLARQIVFYRAKAGRFYSVDQLLQVKGMDSERLELVRSWVTVDGGNRATPAAPPSERPTLAPSVSTPGPTRSTAPRPPATQPNSGDRMTPAPEGLPSEFQDD